MVTKEIHRNNEHTLVIALFAGGEALAMAFFLPPFLLLAAGDAAAAAVAVAQLGSTTSGGGTLGFLLTTLPPLGRW